MHAFIALSKLNSQCYALALNILTHCTIKYFMIQGFKAAAIILVLVVLAWLMLLVNALDVPTHSFYFLDKLEAIY